MKLRDFPILADQNIHADVVAFLRADGLAVVDVADAQLNGINACEARLLKA